MKRRRRLVAGVVVLVLTIPSPLLATESSEAVYLAADDEMRFVPTLGSDAQGVTLVDIDSITPPALSPNGSRVAFSGAIQDESLGRYAIFVVDRDGTGLDQVTTGSLGEFDPAWSPDGQTLVVVQNTGGSLSYATCCRLGLVDVASEVFSPLTGNVGAARPDYSPSGSLIVYDTPAGVWTVPTIGGSSTLVTGTGFDAAFSPDGVRMVYLVDTGSTREIRSVATVGGGTTILYSTIDQLENPVWLDDRIYFTQYAGLGYDGRKSIRLMSIDTSGNDLLTENTYQSPVVGISPGGSNDEMFFYRSDGFFQYYDIDTQAGLGAPILEGTGYSTGWTWISSVDLEGDGSDEMLFYRAGDGVFKYYDMHSDGRLGGLLQSGVYSLGWSSITSVDLEGDGSDEMLFYRAGDGVFKYYDMHSDGRLGGLLQSGVYSLGWSSITSVDLEGDRSDEMLFYRNTDGTFKYYDVKSSGALGPLIRSGTGYTTGWSAITSVDLEGDGQDEMFFYRADGFFQYYNINVQAGLGAPINEGTGYTSDWSSVSSVDLDG